MSNCIPTTFASSVAAVETTDTTSYLSPTLSLRRRHFPPLSLSSSLSTLRLFSQSTQKSKPVGTVATTAQLNNASIGGSSSGAASKPEASAGEIKNSSLQVTPSLHNRQRNLYRNSSPKLPVLSNSRYIVELQMKQPNCELLIRKKEAMIQSSPPPTIVQSHSPQTASTPYVSAPVTAPSASPTPVPSAPKPATSSLPSIKSPMAGTFYRNPAPGAPAFVKVGDKVQKGQVLCIIEAMKLMNEIEADQSGTIVEVLAEDGKPVSLDTPLFAIQP